MRRLSAVLVALLAATVLAGLAPPATAATVNYIPPVDGRVVDGFRPPATPYGRGNRGLTYETAPGAPIRASAPGRVTFAGQVGGALHVVVQHTDGVRTTYAFVRSIDTHVGAVVKQGDRIGAAASSFHFGARIGDAYIDPAILLESGPALVHLVPDNEFSEPGADDDRRSLFEVVRDFAAVPVGAINWAQGQALDALNDAWDLQVATTRRMVEELLTLLDEIVNLGDLGGSFATISAALADTLEAFLTACTELVGEPPRVGERRIAVFVAGLGSHSKGRDDENNLSDRIGAQGLGYATSDTYDFSYRGGRYPEAYAPRDTVHGLDKAAGDLRDLLDRIGQDNPGVPVDVIAHSQGGLIPREALSPRYDGPTRRIPPVGHYISIATPHHGTDPATTFAWLRWLKGGNEIRRLADASHPDFALTSPGVAQLSETSEFIRRINAEPLREGVAYTSIAGSLDYVVPGVRARLRGATNVLVDAGVKNAHSEILVREDTRRELALALNDQPPECKNPLAVARRAGSAAYVASVEDIPGFMSRGY